MMHWFRRRSRSSRRSLPRRRPLLYLEPLETRALLAASSLLNPLVLMARPMPTSALVATPLSIADRATPAAATQSAPLLNGASTLGTGTTPINPTTQFTATTATANTQTVQLVPELQVTPVVNLVQVGGAVFADLSFNVSLTFVPLQAAQTTGTSTSSTPSTTTAQQPILSDPLTLAPTLPAGSTAVPNTAPSGILSATATPLNETPPAVSLATNTSPGVVSQTITSSDARFLLLFAQQPRTQSFLVPVIVNAAADGESLALASPLSPLPSNADRQNVPPATALTITARPNGSLVFGIDQGAPILQRVIGGVGGGVEGVGPEQPEEAPPPVMPWNAASLPAATAPLGHTPAALTILDAVDTVLADDARVGARGEEQVIEDSQGVRTALAPAMAVGALALLLGGCWAPPADAYDREERKLPKGH